ncbi:competence protein ComEC [Brachybacterium endophyticum]|uniref:Competence protein ComEC n=1 Tax=Brachybacterium endophyticum TaxID=2182385 RepID=A0A2U2RI31_9MICO|nr:ComEC/Rec2 family competence protein [Brachybacterium endophyticum]PWH05537.1 competence protein ComEC [Brachybacterium endophyticum]
MGTRADLRILPAATALWGLAVLGIATGVRIQLLAMLALALLALLVAVCVRRPRVLRAVGAHLVLLALGAVLLVPATGRQEAAALTLEDAAGSGRILEAQAVASGDAAASSSSLPGAQDRRQVMARLPAGPVRIGVDAAMLWASSSVLLTGDQETLGAVRDHDHLRLRATVASADGFVVLAVTRLEVVSTPHGPAARIRESARGSTSDLPADEAALARGMTTGDTSGMSESTEEIMRRAGISHLVAVSGANIALVLGAVLVPCLLLGIPRRPRLVLAGLAGAAYVALVGDEPSVLRAATMAAPILVARFLGVRVSPLAALSATIALWSSLDPARAASIGFLLSALATGAILLLAPVLARALVAVSGERVSRTWALVLAVPFSAQAVCTPVLILLTPEISIWAVGVNMAVAPIVGPATVIGMVATVLSPFVPGIAHVLWQVCAGGAHLIILVARTADGLPGSRIAVPEGAAGVVLALGVLALVVIAALGHRSRAVRFVLAAVLVAVLAPPVYQRLPLPGSGIQDWRVAACAVGQGDAVLLREDAARGEDPATVLVDTGPDPDALRRCLDRMQVQRIDLLVLTHPHADHVGGIEALTGRRTPLAQWVCPLPEAAARTVPGAPTQVATTGTTSRQGDLGLEVLWPPSAATVREASSRETGGEDDDFNDCSVTIAATWPDGTRYVGLGDLEPIAQAQLLAGGVREADVVKTAHHGSRRQEPALYDALSPQLMLFTAGRDNSFGHPTAQALGIARREGAGSARTDVDGTVVLTSDQPLVPRGVGRPG